MVTGQPVDTGRQGNAGPGDGPRARGGNRELDPVRANLDLYLIVNRDRGVGHPANELHRRAEFVEHERLGETVTLTLPTRQPLQLLVDRCLVHDLPPMVAGGRVSSGDPSVARRPLHSAGLPGWPRRIPPVTVWPALANQS